MYIYFITVTTTQLTGMQLYHSEVRVTYIKSLPAKPYICPESRYESEKHVQYQKQEKGCQCNSKPVFCVKSIYDPFVYPLSDKHYISRYIGYPICSILRKV